MGLVFLFFVDIEVEYARYHYSGLLLIPVNYEPCHLNIVIDCIETIFFGNLRNELVLMDSELVKIIAQKNEVIVKVINQIYFEIGYWFKGCSYITNLNTKK